MFKSGFVTIIGRPNVGKSTIINKIIGEKISIISDKPQTTRNKIQAVFTDEDSQIIFIDTPGIHKPKNKLGEYMGGEIDSSLEGMDLVVFMTDEKKSLGPGDRYIIEKIKGLKTPVIGLVNKIDIHKNIVNVVSELVESEIFHKVFPISASKGINLEDLVKEIKTNLPEGPKYYPDEYITDRPERFIIAELIREKALNFLMQEVPHGVGVYIDKIESSEEGKSININATIMCEKKSHKGIIIGKQGSMLKKIGTASRKEINKLLGSKTHLDLWVKIKKDWRDDEKTLKELGYRDW
ncbi:MAG: GTPase Era [Eubacteriales bacterium]